MRSCSWPSSPPLPPPPPRPSSRLRSLRTSFTGRFRLGLEGDWQPADGRTYVGRELDVGELVTFLNDAIMGAPDLLLGGGVTWREVDAHGFDVTLEDAGTRVSARVTVDDRGAPTDFSTTDRFFVDPTDARSPPVRTRWTKRPLTRVRSHQAR